MPQIRKVFDKKGKPEKHKKFNFLQYLIKLKNNRHKSKKSIHYYYDGLRDDKIPKKLLSSFNKKNSFSELDKEIGLKKLNELLDECNSENPAEILDAENKTKICKNFSLNFYLEFLLFICLLF